MKKKNTNELNMKKLSRLCHKAQTPEEMQSVIEEMVGDCFLCFCVSLEKNGDYRLIRAALLDGDDLLSAIVAAEVLRDYEEGAYQPEGTELTQNQLLALVGYGSGFLFMLNRSERTVHVSYLPKGQRTDKKKAEVLITLLEVL